MQVQLPEATRPLQHASQQQKDDIQTLIETVSVDTLAHRVTEEAAKFLRHAPYDDRFALALVTRALLLHDDAAWYYVYHQYAPLVLSWILRHSSAQAVLYHESVEALTDDSFMKFSRTLSSGGIREFRTLSSLLAYLKRCTWSVVSDAYRKLQTQRQEESLERECYDEPVLDDHADQVVQRMFLQEVWHIVQEELHAPRERLLVSLMYEHDMKISEIACTYPALFPTIQQAYQVRRLVLQKLRRNRRLKMFMNLLSLESQCETKRKPQAFSK